MCPRKGRRTDTDVPTDYLEGIDDAAPCRLIPAVLHVRGAGARQRDPARSEASQGLLPKTRSSAEAAMWIARHGKAADAEPLVQHLSDASPPRPRNRRAGVVVLWSHSGDEATDAPLARG
jgi:hypothetical protein